MNYNNYNTGYAGYSNGRYLYNPSYVPNYQPNYMAQPNQDPMNGIFFNHIRYVNQNEMASYVVLPNNTDMIIDKTNGIVQIKSADQMGNSFTRNFKFEELNDQTMAKTEEDKKAPEIDLSGYVKTEDLKDFIKVDALESFSKQLDDKFAKLEKQIDKQIKIKDILGDKD